MTRKNGLSFVVETLFGMVDSRIGVLDFLALLSLLSAGTTSRLDETFCKMRVENGSNVRRYRRIENATRTRLASDMNADISPLHLLIHPKANHQITESIARILSENRSLMVRMDSDETEIADVQVEVENHRSKIISSKVSSIVAIYDDVEDLNPQEWRRIYGDSWNPRSKVAIWITRSFESCENEDSLDRNKLEEILEDFWLLDCINVVLLAMPIECANKNTSFGIVEAVPRVFGYDPFTRRVGRADKRGRLIERSGSDEPLFPDKLMNLEGLPIAVSMYNQEPHSVIINASKLGSGTEVEALRYVSSWLNFSIQLVTAPNIDASSYKVALRDGNIVGPVGDILKNRSAFLANVEYLDEVYIADVIRFEYVRPFTLGYVGIVVPRAGPMPGIIRIFRSIDTTISLLTFLCSVIIIVYLYASKKRSPILESYRLVIHQQLHEIGDRSSERIFSISCIIWAFILCTATQTQLIKDLTDPPFYKDIQTLAELASSSLTLMADQIHLDTLNNSKNEAKHRLAMTAVSEPDFSRCTKRLVKYGDVACAIDRAYIFDAVDKINRRSISRELIESNYNHHLHSRGIARILDQHLTRFWKTVIVKQGFPYLNKFNDAFERMLEFGLIHKWWLDTTRQHFGQKLGPSNGGHDKLNMSHFDGSFKILFLGAGFASFIFFVEILLHRFRSRSS